MSALALPAAPRWPAALAWILGLGGLAALLALQIESVQAARVHGGFGFLFQASGFRISESLLDVLPEDPYWMSLAAGLVNTLTVALAALPWPRCWAWLGLARLSPDPVASRLAASSSRRCATPRCCCNSLSGTACCCACDARQAWEPLPSVLLSNRGLALPALRWLPQAASLIVAMLIAGWAIRRRRLATDGPAHRGRSAHPRRALAGAGRLLLAWTFLPAPIVELPVRRGLACKAAGNPASNSPRWSSACRCSMPPISPTSCAPRCARCRRAGRGRTGAGAVAPGHPAPGRRAQRRARGAAALRQPVPGADQEQHAGHRHRLPGPDGRHQHRHHADRPGAGRHLAGAGGLSGPGPGAGRRVVRVERAPRRHGRAICMARAWANGRHCLRPRKAADAGRRLARTCCWRRCSPPVRSSTGLAQRRLARRRGGLRASRRRLLGRRGREPALLLFGAMQPAHRGPALVACAALLLAVAVALGAGRCPDGYAPASPSPRWRLPPARCPAGPGAARPSARCAGAACWSR